MIDAIAASGLRGRGGAGFPAGRKWASVRDGSDDPGDRYVVANGAEGEPGTFKDRALIAANPYQVLEGLAIAAETLGAAHAFLAIKASFRRQREVLDRAIAEMRAADLLGVVPITIVEGPDEYLFGEEKALLEVIEGEDPLPRLLPPYIHGLFATRPQVGWSADPGVADAAPEGSNPTLVNNVETFANVAPILDRGPEWYRSLGTVGSPGHVICTVVGDVRRAGVAEVELGRTLAEVVVHIGAGTRPDRALKAVLSGVANPVITAADIDVPVSYEGMAAIGSGLGACGFIVYDDTRDMVAVARGVSRFLFVESCGQCPPCKQGTGEVTELLDELLAGRATDADIELMGARLTTVTDSNRCFLGAQEQRVIGSLLRAFPADFVAHLEGAAPAEPVSIPKLVDILDDGTAIHDERQERKQPDWTYADGA
ncbi:MAG: NADH-ubiquinone oxidoreductase-F iron-sulfur binding region domain-containing protein [Acidimicrobiia bacterium]